MKLPGFLEAMLHLRREAHEDAQRDVERRRERAERLLRQHDALVDDFRKLETDIRRRS